MVTKKIKLVALSSLLAVSGTIKPDWKDWLTWGTQAALVGTQASVVLGDDVATENCYNAYELGSNLRKLVYTGEVLCDDKPYIEKAWNLGAMGFDYNPALADPDNTLLSISEGLQVPGQVHATAENIAQREPSGVHFSQEYVQNTEDGPELVSISRVTPLSAEYLAGTGLCHCLANYVPTWCSAQGCASMCTNSVAAYTPSCASFTLPVTQTITLGLVSKAALFAKFTLGAVALYAGHKACEYVAPQQYKRAKDMFKMGYDRVKQLVNNHTVVKYGAVSAAVLYKVWSDMQEREFAAEQLALAEQKAVAKKLAAEQAAVANSSVFSKMLHCFVAMQNKMTA